MTEIHRLPDIEDAQRQASEWIARLQADDADAADRARFEAWYGAHPRHARAYDELMTTWRRLSDAGRTVRAVSFGQAMQAATRVRRRRHAVAGFAAAAVLAMLAVGGWWQWRSPSTFETGIGEHVAVSLPDGSRLELNSDSAVRVDYRDDARVIRLDRGEAFFTVAHAPDRPFWVVADRTWVRAVGTAFNVYLRERDVRVTVSEGRVKVAAAASHRERPSDALLARLPASLLEAGQQADLRGAGTQVRRLPAAAVDSEVAWRSGTLHFENRPLHEVVTELGRYTPVRVELGADVRELPVGGSFQASPQGTEALLGMLHDGFGLQVRREGDRRVRVE